MTDSPDWRRWADQAHRQSLEGARTKRRVLYRCTSCHHRTTRRTAQRSGYDCTHCGSPLRVKAQMKERRIE